MPNYVLMTRLSMEVAKDPRGRKAMGREWKKMVDDLCPEVTWVAHYALLGPYDFMDIYEAPSEEVAHKVSFISRASGALMAESWPAMPWDSYVSLTGEVASKTG